jgi:hypothetical protein
VTDNNEKLLLQALVTTTVVIFAGYMGFMLYTCPSVLIPIGAIVILFGLFWGFYKLTGWRWMP